MEKRWFNMQLIMHKYAEEFPEELVTKDVFYWSYLFVMTRSFGYCIPSTSLIPFADLMNHNNYTITS